MTREAKPDLIYLQVRSTSLWNGGANGLRNPAACRNFTFSLKKKRPLLCNNFYKEFFGKSREQIRFQTEVEFAEHHHRQVAIV